MRLHTERAEVERSNVGQETAFQIKTTAKAFDILSSGLYTDNILAVVRELSCNAYDAHVAAKNADTPFEIHLPNRMEPWFHVKDFGVGLSEDDVMGLYTTYFDSTKTDSNDYIGALGLGSKSPFSYANAFEVISRFNGKRMLFSVFINEDGVPTIAKMGEVDTDEPNGLEVKLAVKEEDFYRFKDKTAKALKWFPVKPKVIGNAGFRFESVPDHRIKGTGWHLLPRSYGDPNMTAIQGNVAYAVNLNQIELDQLTRNLLDNGHLACHFEIGDLEVAASREEIRYDKRSKEALIARIDVFRKEVVGQIEKQADQVSKSFWHATIELNDISMKMFGSEGGLRAFLNNNGGTNHKVLKRYCDQNGRLDLPTPHGWELVIYHPGGRYGRGKNLSRKHVGQSVEPKGDMAVFVNDLKVGGVARLNQFVKTTDWSSALTMRRNEKVSIMKEDKNGDLHPYVYTEKDYQKEFKELIEALGDPDVKIVSKDTEKVKRAASGTRTLPIFQYGGTRERSNSYGYRRRSNERVEWDRVDHDEFDIDNGGLYFILRNGTKLMTQVGDQHIEVNWPADEVERKIKTMVELINKHYPDLDDFAFEDVYAVGSLGQNKVKKMDNWFNIFDLVRAIVPKYKDAIEFFASKTKTSDDLGIKDLIGNKDFTDHVRKLSKASPFRQNIMPLLDGQDKYADDQIAASFLRKFDHLYGANLFDDVGTPFYTNGAFNMYPMLSFVGTIRVSSYNNTDLGVLFDYIKLIDKGAKA